MVELTGLAKSTYAGKSVLLTGAAGGFGKELAFQLAHCQVDTLVLTDRDEAGLKATIEECKSINSNVKALPVPGDLNNKESVKKLGEEALRLCGAIDVLINCGGISSRSNFVDTTLEVDERVMQINFFAGVNLAKTLVPKMVEQKEGKIIWVSSVQGLVGIPSRTSYAASKFAVQGYCESLRAELASSGVSVHVISPGYMRTNLSRAALTGDGTAHGKLDATTAAGADPRDVAVIVFNAIANGTPELVVASPTSARVAIWARFLCPSLLRMMLVKRHDKAENEKQKHD